MTLYQKFKKLNIDHAAIGFALCGTNEPYYCTPKDAVILGWAGVDGIHYCTIPQFGETIFAVSPMNFGDCVHPIARNFEDLLRLLLSCADMAALEQCFAWEQEQFRAFLLDCPATAAQQAALDAIRQQFGLEPMPDAFAYIKKLQAEFDLSQIPYTEDYYDEDMNPAAPAQISEWEVTYDGGFWGGQGEAGVELSLGKTFAWGQETWHIPALYLCNEGLVVDFLLEADPAPVKAFLDKWDLYNEDRNHYTREQRQQMEQENPLDVDFCSHLLCGGRRMQCRHGCAVTWLPSSCLPAGLRAEPEALQVLEHYGLDRDHAWAIHRCSYQWDDPEEQELCSLSVCMERAPARLCGPVFATPAAGESIALPHPLTGQVYTLTAHEAEAQKLPEHAFPADGMEHPACFTAMRYSLEPDIAEPGFLLEDCADGDFSRPQKQAADHRGPTATACAAVMGIIGGADGPTALITGKTQPKLHAACSSLHFEPVDLVEWRALFYEKQLADVELRLL